MKIFGHDRTDYRKLGVRRGCADANLVGKPSVSGNGEIGGGTRKGNPKICAARILER